MTQHIPVEPTKSINPVLQAALSSLDVQLEEELARYRRQKLGRPVMTPKGLGRHQTRKALDLIAVERVEAQPPRPALGMSTAPLADFPLYMVQPPPEAADATPEPAPASPGMVVASSNQTAENLDTPPQIEQPTPSQQPSNLATVITPQAPPEDYLESSEQLIRSLAQDEKTPPPKKNFAAKLLTPLGVGSILLLLLSGATAAVVLSNPSLLDRFFGKKTSTPAQNPTEPTSMTENSGKDAPVVKGPDLASEEFVDLNLNTLSHLEASPKPSPSAPAMQVPALPTLPNGAVIPPVAPTVVPNTALPRRAADLSSVLLTPPPQAGNPPYTPIPKIAPLPTPASVAPQSSTPKSNSSAATNKSNQTKANKSNQNKASSNSATANKSNQSKASISAATNKSNQTKAKNTSAVANKSNQNKASSNSATANKSNKSSVSQQSTTAKTTASQKQPASASPIEVAATPVGIPGGYYYVLLDTNGEGALEQARTIVPDAYVENFPKGERIQMGAFPTESEAKTMVEKLHKQGLVASIYHPSTNN